MVNRRAGGEPTVHSLPPPPSHLHLLGLSESRRTSQHLPRLAQGRRSDWANSNLSFLQVSSSESHKPKEADPQCTPHETRLRPRTSSRHSFSRSTLWGTSRPIPSGAVTPFPQQQRLLRSASAGSLAAHAGPTQCPKVRRGPKPVGVLGVPFSECDR